jgi:hypothetical protein
MPSPAAKNTARFGIRADKSEWEFVDAEVVQRIAIQEWNNSQGKQIIKREGASSDFVRGILT